MVFWFFGKIWKNKNHTGFIRLGSGRKGWFHVVSFSGAWHFFEYEQRPYPLPMAWRHYSFWATNRFPRSSCRDIQSNRACVSPGGLLADMMDDSIHSFLATDSDGYSAPTEVKSSFRTKGQWTGDEDLQLIWCVLFVYRYTALIDYHIVIYQSENTSFLPFCFDTSLLKFLSFF